MARRKAERAEDEEALAKKKAEEQAKQESIRAKVVGGIKHSCIGRCLTLIQSMNHFAVVLSI